MSVELASWGSIWPVFLGIFLVGQLVRWSAGGRWARRPWNWYGDDDDWNWRRGHRRSRHEYDQARAEEQALLDARLAELDQLQSRVTELENRLDFAERMLAQQKQSGMSAPLVESPVPAVIQAH
jgi:hypothetical protein